MTPRPHVSGPTSPIHTSPPASVPITPAQSTAPYFVNMVLSAITDRSMEPVLDSGNNSSWAKVLASLEREYWITEGRDKVKSLKDLL